MQRVGFKPAIPASERPQIDALDLAATGIGLQRLVLLKYPRFYRPFVFWVSLIISSMVQQPLVDQGFFSEVFTITLRYATLGRTPLDE